MLCTFPGIIELAVEVLGMVALVLKILEIAMIKGPQQALGIAGLLSRGLAVRSEGLMICWYVVRTGHVGFIQYQSCRFVKFG